MLLTATASFIVGIIITLICAEVFLNFSIDLAKLWGISPLIISLVIIAMGTNLPEITVTISALANNDAGLALGNTVGSTIANSTLVLGIGSLVHSIHVDAFKTQRSVVVMLLVSAVFVFLRLSQMNHFIQASILILALIISIGSEFVVALSRANHTKKKRKKPKLTYSFPIQLYYVLILAAAAGLGIGGQVIVTSVEKLSETLSISTTFLGLTLTAIATSAPEMITSILAGVKNQKSMILGTILGSNIINLTLIPTMVILSDPGLQVPMMDLFFVLLAAIFLTVTINTYRNRVIPRIISFSLILLFVAFLGSTTLTAL